MCADTTYITSKGACETLQPKELVALYLLADEAVLRKRKGKQSRFLVNAFWDWSSVRKAANQLGCGNVLPPKLAKRFKALYKMGALARREIKSKPVMRGGVVYSRRFPVVEYRAKLEVFLADLMLNPQTKKWIENTIAWYERDKNRDEFMKFYNTVFPFLEAKPSAHLDSLRLSCFLQTYPQLDARTQHDLFRLALINAPPIYLKKK